LVASTVPAPDLPVIPLTAGATPRPV